MRRDLPAVAWPRAPRPLQAGPNERAKRSLVVSRIRRLPTLRPSLALVLGQVPILSALPTVQRRPIYLDGVRQQNRATQVFPKLKYRIRYEECRLDHQHRTSPPCGALGKTAEVDELSATHRRLKRFYKTPVRSEGRLGRTTADRAPASAARAKDIPTSSETALDRAAAARSAKEGRRCEKLVPAVSPSKAGTMDQAHDDRSAPPRVTISSEAIRCRNPATVWW